MSIDLATCAAAAANSQMLLANIADSERKAVRDEYYTVNSTYNELGYNKTPLLKK